MSELMTAAGAHRISEDEMDVPVTPTHPIGFNDALKIFVQMGGPEAPPEWRGKLNTTYKIGPQLRVPGWYHYRLTLLPRAHLTKVFDSGWNWRKIRMEVYNDKKILPTYNVIGYIRGQVEPDRYVIYGNHRDCKLIIHWIRNLDVCLTLSFDLLPEQLGCLARWILRRPRPLSWKSCVLIPCCWKKVSNIIYNTKFILDGDVLMRMKSTQPIHGLPITSSEAYGQ